MAILGLRDVSSFQSDNRPLSWRNTYRILYPNGKAKLTALTSMMKTRTVSDPTFNWWEKMLQTRRVALSANITAAATAIAVTAGAKGFKAGDILRVEQTGEHIRIASDPSSDTALFVERGFAGTTPAAVDYDGVGINPNLIGVGSAYEEGSLSPTGVTFQPTKYTNNTQIFRNTIEWTRTAMKTKLRTKDDVKESKRECLELHNVDMERAFIFGVKSEGVLNGKRFSTTNGILQHIPASNKKVATAAGVDLEEFEEYTHDIFKYGSDQKMGYCGNRGLLTINQMVRKNSHFNLTPPEIVGGMRMMRFVCPFGELLLNTHPLFTYAPGGINAGTNAYVGMDSSLLVIDQAELTYVTLEDSDTKYEKDLQANDMDGMKSGYITECGLEMGHGITHYFIEGLLAGAADD